jgi:hypothetical protein
MNEQEQDRLKQILQEAVPPMDGNPELGRDLWPAMLRRLDENPAALPWFDWALLAGLAGVVAFFPASIPLLLYCI